MVVHKLKKRERKKKDYETHKKKTGKEGRRKADVMKRERGKEVKRSKPEEQLFVLLVLLRGCCFFVFLFLFLFFLPWRAQSK